MRKILLIDIDDTLLNFRLGERVAITETLHHFGLPDTEETINYYISVNLDLWKAFERGEITKPRLLLERFDRFFEKLGVDGLDSSEFNDFYFEMLRNQCEYMDGADEFLDKISRYYRIFLVTNGTADIQFNRLKLSGLGERVEDVFISELLGAKKPDKEYFDIVAQSIKDFDKNNAVMVGDSLTSDILGGNNYGLKTIWFNPHHRSNTHDIIPDYEVASFDELYTILQS